MKGNNVKILSRRRDALGTLKDIMTIAIDEIELDGVTDLKVNAGMKEFTTVTITFLVRNIEWVTTDR